MSAQQEGGSRDEQMALRTIERRAESAIWGDFSDDEASIQAFKTFRTPGIGWDLVINKNQFLTGLFPSCMLRELTDEEEAVYLAPFQTAESRQTSSDIQDRCGRYHPNRTALA